VPAIAPQNFRSLKSIGGLGVEGVRSSRRCAANSACLTAPTLAIPAPQAWDAGELQLLGSGDDHLLHAHSPNTSSGISQRPCSNTAIVTTKNKHCRSNRNSTINTVSSALRPASSSSALRPLGPWFCHYPSPSVGQTAGKGVCATMAITQPHPRKICAERQEQTRLYG